MSTKSKFPDNKEKENHTTLIVSSIPETLKTEFKLHCVREGLSMSEVLVEVIRRLIREGRIKGTRR